MSHVQEYTNRCKKLALEKGGKFLSLRYQNQHTQYQWQCNNGHTWSASLKDARIKWCLQCSLPIKINQGNIHQPFISQKSYQQGLSINPPAQTIDKFKVETDHSDRSTLVTMRYRFPPGSPVYFNTNSDNVASVLNSSMSYTSGIPLPTDFLNNRSIAPQIRTTLQPPSILSATNSSLTPIRSMRNKSSTGHQKKSLLDFSSSNNLIIPQVNNLIPQVSNKTIEPVVFEKFI